MDTTAIILSIISTSLVCALFVFTTMVENPKKYSKATKMTFVLAIISVVSTIYYMLLSGASDIPM